jgi:hypothetical protein
MFCTVDVQTRPIVAVVDVGCKCGLCNSRFGMQRRDEDEPIQAAGSSGGTGWSASQAPFR